MNSRTNYSAALSYSAVYDSRPPINPIYSARNYLQQQQNSYLLSAISPKNTTFQLRNTIGTETYNMKKKEDPFLRQTSYFAKNKYSEGSGASSGGNKSIKGQIESELTVDKILQKNDKKTRIINELKKLSEIKLSSKLRSDQMQKEDDANLACPGYRYKADFTYLTEKMLNKGEKDKKKQSKPTIEEFYTPKSIKAESQKYIHDKKYTPTNSSYINSSPLIQAEFPSFSYESNKSKENTSIKQVRGYQKRGQSHGISAKINYFQNKTNLNDFIIGKSLGEGKFGTVYQVLHRSTNSLFALKKIKKEMIKTHLMEEQFIREIKIQSFCNHENILKLYGFFDDSQYFYLILQYMEEGTLYSKLKKKKTLNQQDAAVILNQVAKAIKYLHDIGIAHRDIKPENIVISNNVGKICDFGWAAICNQRRTTYCGTFDYAAPQILEGNEYDMAVDLWCLGVLAYQLLVGKAPFYHISRKQTMKRILNVESTSIQFPLHLSKNAVSFIEKLIKKRPEQRMFGQDILCHPFLKLNA